MKFLREMLRLVYKKINAAASKRLSVKTLHCHLYLVPVHATSL